MTTSLDVIASELKLATTAYQCLCILAETPGLLGLQAVGFREEMTQPVLPTIVDGENWALRFGWPPNFVDGWITKGHASNFPARLARRKNRRIHSWLLPASNAAYAKRGLTSEELETIQYMHNFDICSGVTVVTPLSFGQLGCISWFSKNETQHLVDGAIANSLQRIVENFFDGIDRNRQWTTASPLSPRETECLQWTARGLTDKEIAHLVGRSVHTINFHLKSAIKKLGAANRTHAVALAVHAKIINPVNTC
ncbi:MAG: helix-turn-helix transcriptional regulator [Gammaproteobacteria bacterium]|nr:helix-turn-helix transcriptional regulator [Gammaproteobacteria bacterium]